MGLGICDHFNKRYLKCSLLALPRKKKKKEKENHFKSWQFVSFSFSTHLIMKLTFLEMGGYMQTGFFMFVPNEFPWPEKCIEIWKNLQNIP